MKRATPARHLLVFAAPLMLSACISVSLDGLGKGEDQPDPTTYTLLESKPDVVEVAAETAGRIVIVVPTPEVPPGFDSERLSIRFEDGRVDHYADARWSARLDQLLQDTFVERAQRKLPAAIVGKLGVVPAANYRLLVKITDFGPIYKDAPDMPPRLDAGLNLTVIELPSQMVKTQFTVTKTAPASENRLSVVTSELKTLVHAAFDEALDKAAPYISEPQNLVRSN